MALADIISAAAAKYGVDPAFLTREAEIESGMNPNAANPNSSAKGLFQFTDKTRAGYGGFDPFSAEASADAGAHLAADNARVLRTQLGREPTAGELYLAHQQGASGAAKLLMNPDAPAEQLVGARAVQQNGGRAGMSARDFAALWTNKFGDGAMKVPQSAPVAVLASEPRAAAPALGVLMENLGSDAAQPAVSERAPVQKRSGLDTAALFASLSKPRVLVRG